MLHVSNMWFDRSENKTKFYLHINLFHHYTDHRARLPLIVNRVIWWQLTSLFIYIHRYSPITTFMSYRSKYMYALIIKAPKMTFSCKTRTVLCITNK